MAAVALFVAIGVARSQGSIWSFDDVPAGRPPLRFLFPGMPGEPAGQWSVLRDGSNGVLAHAPSGEPTTQLAVVEGTSFADVMVSARLRFGQGSGAAGLVWRYLDAANHYVLSLDFRAQDVRIYRVVGGNRTRLEQEDDLELDPAAWQLLKVEHRGTSMRVWINGVPVAGARDRSPGQPGAVGVWTRGDAAAWFDDLRAEPLVDSPRGNRRD